MAQFSIMGRIRLLGLVFNLFLGRVKAKCEIFDFALGFF